MKGQFRLRAVLRAISGFLTFFLLIAFVITCCLTLFITTLQTTLGFTFTEAQISAAAKVTMLNVVAISIVFFIIDYFRRKITVQYPIKKITEAAEKMIAGDFDVRIKKTSKFMSDDTFNEIIEIINKIAVELGGVETLRTDFIADVSHEIKTPLSVIQNYGKLLETSDLPEQKRIEYAKGITDATRRLSQMITNVLKLNRLENQQIYPNCKEYDLGEQLCECLLQYENLWEISGIEINTDIAENVTVNADYELLNIVWNNLFSNAFKFTQSGGTVSVSLSVSGEYAVVDVKDTGCGMSAEVGEHIFEKFYQGDNSRSSQGNGLGLALVKRIIDIVHGEINVESKLNSGSVFTVKIRRI